MFACCEKNCCLLNSASVGGILESVAGLEEDNGGWGEGEEEEEEEEEVGGWEWLRTCGAETQFFAVYFTTF